MVPGDRFEDESNKLSAFTAIEIKLITTDHILGGQWVPTCTEFCINLGIVHILVCTDMSRGKMSFINLYKSF